MDDAEFLREWRETLLRLVDILERKLNISPRTAELRKEYRRRKALTPAVEDDTIAVGS